MEMPSISLSKLNTVFWLAFGVLLMGCGCGDRRGGGGGTAAATKRVVPTDPAVQLQEDRDGLRLEHLLHWTGLIEEYHAKTGTYPLQDKLTAGASITGSGMVRIATRGQQRFFDPQHADYRADLDNNGQGSFQEFPVAELVKTLEAGLGRTIDEKYDVQATPDQSVIWYPYFFDTDGYLMWVPCLSCGVTTASTLTMDGKTPTVNIGARPLINGIPKAMTRDEMQAHADFKRWLAIPFHKETDMRTLEATYHSDSKK